MNSKAIKRQLLAAIAMVLVATIALGSSTYAWFVSNTEVQATSSSVKSTSATPNLLIVAGATETGGADGTTWTAKKAGGKTVESISSTAATALYPASTNDCKAWWVVSGWTGNDGNAPKANKYYNPAITATANGDNAKNGQYTQGSTTLNAYQVTTYSVYTTTGEVDLNLNPANPINVDISSGAAQDTGTGFKDALRVGIVVNGELKLVYAPTAETGTGNDADGAAGYRTVKDGTSTQAAGYNHVEADTFTGWTATSKNDGTYQKAGNSLGKVTTEGVVVQIYVWLEGTDADCLVGTADAASDKDSYKVTLNFVGATVDAAVGP